MYRRLFEHEFKLMFFSKKNIIFIVLLASILFLYVTIILPEKAHIETFNTDEVKEQVGVKEVLQDQRREEGHTGYGVMTGFIYGSEEYYVRIYNKMLNAYQNEDFRRFIHLRVNYLLTNNEDYVNSEQAQSAPIPNKDADHLFKKTLTRFEHYLELDHPITYSMIEEKTALQQLHQFILSTLIYIVIFSAIYFSSNILTKDRTHQSLLRGIPMNWYHTMSIKSFVSLVYTLLTIMILGIFAITLIGLIFGFGHLKLGLVTANYDMMYTNELLLKIGPLLILLIFMFIRLNVMLSLIFKHAAVVLSISTAFLISEFFYYSRRTRELFNIDLSYLPQTYFDIGKIVTNEKNFLLNTETITYTQGIIVLVCTFILIEISLFMTTILVTKRRFFNA
ncbi:hypothetical protein ACTWQB_05710 [Piscibacillus sp. B03]|uniref:hypothetical protein n=1 Tax=Piscibacillus sp. B03 TaxID=3457430 RepID=UPI003FCDF230